MRGILDTAFKLNNLIIYSLKRKEDLNMLREQTASKNSGCRTSLPSILDNWAVFKELLDKILK